jgi:hypothetical protein
MLEKVINEKVHQHLMQTIGHYKDIVEKLQNGMQNIVWDWEFKEGKSWTKDMRQSQASILKEVMALEQKAVIGIKKIVKAI